MILYIEESKTAQNRMYIHIFIFHAVKYTRSKYYENSLIFLFDIALKMYTFITENQY